MYIFQLALRYTRARKINFVAVLAVALCLTVQIVVMAVLDGMLVDMQTRIRNLGEQITLRFDQNPPSVAEMNRVAEVLEPSGVIGITPLISGYGILDKDHSSKPAIIYGIDLARECELSALPNHLQNMKLDRKKPTWLPEGQNDRPGCFIGVQLANQLGIFAGDEVTISYAPPDTDKLIRKHFRVGDLVRSGHFKDAYAVYIPIENAREFFLSPPTGSGVDTRVSIFSLWLEHPDRAEIIEKEVWKKAADTINRPQKIIIKDNWQRQWHDMSEGMKHENFLQEIILVLMNLSGGFCVFAILATLVSRRVRDVGLLRCIGAGRGEVTFVFLLVGLLIGVTGAVLGVGGGYLLALDSLVIKDRTLVDWLYQQITGEVLYPPYMYGIAKLTTVINPVKVFLYAIGAVLISVLAAVYPAIWAGSREPVEALRDE